MPPWDGRSVAALLSRLPTRDRLARPVENWLEVVFKIYLLKKKTGITTMVLFTLASFSSKRKRKSRIK